MTILTVLTAPNKKLEQPAEKVTDVTLVQELIDDMFETLYATGDGVGLASVQVGRKESVVVIDISEDRSEPMVLINPEVVHGENIESGQEGCLSVPGYYADVARYTTVTVTALDREGNELEIHDDGFLAIAMQHEIDHLKGTLFIDYLSPLKKKMALKKVKKSIK